MKIVIQENSFDINAEYNLLAANRKAGAVSIFVGQVRDFNQDNSVKTLTLEHYPGMAENQIAAIAAHAQQRWNICDVTVIHRVGDLKPLDKIVFVGVSSAHRGDAINACEFIIDHLKSDVPFWKKETTATKTEWLEPNSNDQATSDKWS